MWTEIKVRILTLYLLKNPGNYITIILLLYYYKSKINCRYKNPSARILWCLEVLIENLPERLVGF